MREVFSAILVLSPNIQLLIEDLLRLYKERNTFDNLEQRFLTKGNIY